MLGKLKETLDSRNEASQTVEQLVATLADMSLRLAGFQITKCCEFFSNGNRLWPAIDMLRAGATRWMP